MLQDNFPIKQFDDYNISTHPEFSDACLRPEVLLKTRVEKYKKASSHFKELNENEFEILKVINRYCKEEYCGVWIFNLLKELLQKMLQIYRIEEIE